MSMQISIFLLILVMVILPFVFRRAFGVRVLSVMVLGGIALLHFTSLMAMRRVVIEDGVRQLGVANAGQLPPGFTAAANSAGRFAGSEMCLFAALMAALLFLALFPFGILKSQSPK